MDIVYFEHNDYGKMSTPLSNWIYKMFEATIKSGEDMDETKIVNRIDCYNSYIETE